MRSEPAASARRVERLSRLREFEVDRSEPDPRGWTVLDRGGQAIGEVKDLLVDTDRMTATYLDVELDGKLFDLRDDDPHVLVPVGRARADGKRLVVDEITADWVTELRSARARHRDEFWDRWWHGTDRETVAEPTAGTRLRRRTAPDELQRVVDDIRPGEEVRIPVVKEEIIVERRPVEREELVTNRAADEPPRRR